MMVMLVMSKARRSRIAEVLDEKPSINDDEGDAELNVNDGSIEF